MTTNTVRSALPARPSPRRRPGWTTPALSGAAVLAVATLLPAITAARAPLAGPNEMQELGYPLVAAPIGLLLVALAVRIALRSSSRWAGLLALTGAGWLVNGLMVALRSLGTIGGLPHLPFVAATWIGQWSYVWPDVATLVLLPLALPAGRFTGRWRLAAAAVTVLAAVQLVCGALGSGRMDDAALTNPFGVAPGLLAIRDTLYLPVMLAGVVLVLARAVAVRRVVSGPAATGLAASVITLLAAELAEGVLQGMPVPIAVPWIPAAAAVAAAALVWSRMAARYSS